MGEEQEGEGLLRTNKNALIINTFGQELESVWTPKYWGSKPTFHQDQEKNKPNQTKNHIFTIFNIDLKKLINGINITILYFSTLD